VALEQHFGDGGGGGEVAVDLERRMRVEQVAVDAAPVVAARAGRHHGEQVVENAFGAFALEKTGA